MVCTDRGFLFCAKLDWSLYLKTRKCFTLLQNLVVILICLRYLKPGSHMPPMHLRHGRRYCLEYCFNMRTKAACNVAPPMAQSSTPSMPAKLTRVRRHAGSKTLRWLELPAAHVPIRSRGSSGSTGGYNAGSSAAYENKALEANTDFIRRSYLENVPKRKPAPVVVHVIY